MKWELKSSMPSWELGSSCVNCKQGEDFQPASGCPLCLSKWITSWETIQEANNHFISGYPAKGLIPSINLVIPVGGPSGELPLPPLDMKHLCDGHHLGEATGKNLQEYKGNGCLREREPMRLEQVLVSRDWGSLEVSKDEDMLIGTIGIYVNGEPYVPFARDESGN